MTESEALKIIVEDGIELGAGDYVEIEALEVAAKALEEIQQYRKIGTVEECRLYKGISEKDFSTACLDLKMIDELREYKNIGTVEECREAMEKQKKLEIEEFGICPLCYYDFGHEKANYCPNCGHALVLGG